MCKSWMFCVCVMVLLAVPALAQRVTETTISVTPNPATTAESLTISASGRGACPVFGDIGLEGDVLRVEISTECPFAPPTPFTIETTVDPLPAGSYDVELVLPDERVLATTALEVVDQDVCFPSDTILCLNNRRFQVEVEFSAPNGQSGMAQARPFTDESGLFTFFNEENVELIVKVLDACGTQFNSFWVFTAGLTNVEVEITVTDTATEQVKSYNNVQGTVFSPILDTRAFETCP
ncbi:MAG: hypothetical protein KDD47_03845 [Acidobacteria bacterium]|nr:hypothetical protein [Acidobacteriota bacterium]